MDFRVIIVVVATDPKNASSIVDKGAETGQKVVRQAKSGNLPGIAVDPVVEVKGELKKMVGVGRGRGLAILVIHVVSQELGILC